MNRGLGVLAAAVAGAHRSFRYDLSPAQRGELVAYSAFVLTVPVVRGLTRAVRAGWGPFRDVQVGDTHIHHYVPGIALIAAAGLVGVRGSGSTTQQCLAAAGYGTGCALVCDELPLLLQLRDVYWLPEGSWRVQLTLSVSAAVGAYLAGIPLWRAVADAWRAEPALGGTNEEVQHRAR